MKRLKRFLALLLCLTLTVAAFPASVLEANAESIPSVTIDGASIRTTGDAGLRFKITVQQFSQALDYGIKLTHNDKTITVSPANGYDKVYSYDETADTVEYTAVITGLKASDLNKEFEAAGFVSYEQNGQTVTNETDAITRSIQQVADLAGYYYDDASESWIAGTAPTSEAPVTTETSDSSETQTTTEASDSSETQATTEASDSSETQATTEASDSSETQATTEASDSSETQATTEASDSSETQATTEASDSNETQATTEASDSSETPDATTQAPATSEAPDATTQAPATSETPDATTQAPSTDDNIIQTIGDFRIAKISDGCSVSENADGAATISFTNSYDAVYLAFPEGKTAADYASVTINLTCSEQFGFALTDSECNNIKTSYPAYTVTYSTTADYTLTFDTVDTDVTTPLSEGTLLRIMTLHQINNYDAKHYPITLNSITFREKKLPQENGETLLSTYKDIFGYVGNAIDLAHLQNSETVNYIKSEYNSVTLGNEMKPDYILQKNYAKTLIATSDAPSDYVIPEGYTEEQIPELNFEKVDKTLQLASENGLKMRGHTLIWHSQTPSWFFRENYDSNGDFVTPEVMNQRIIFYVTNVMEHVCNSEYADVIYAWDVANEYLHQGTNSSNSGWVGVYGDSIVQGGKLITNPEYVKLAFATASSILEKHNMRDSVHLFYNDYNTYGVIDECCELIDYLNTQDDLNSNGTKLCDGIGMQSHLDVMYPNMEIYFRALDTFIAKGYEIQITELDVTLNYLGNENTEEQRLVYWQDLMEGIVKRQKQSHAITSFTIWGMYDDISWRSEKTPLLFSHSYYEPKDAYYIVLEAAKLYYED